MKRKVKRRDFLKTIGLGAASLALPGGPGRAGAPEGGPAARGGPSPLRAGSGGGPGKNPPNLLIIHTDQQNLWTIGAYGGALIDTPHIDSIAREGARFGNFFTNSGVCTPSRGCFLTGRYPHAHGAYKNNVPMNRDEITLAAVLAAKGYDTGYAGKWHLDGRPKPGWVRPERSMGFSDCRFMFNRGHWKKIVEEGDGEHPVVSPYKVIGGERTYTTDWLAEKTAAFIEKPRGKPFFFMVSIPDPHPPYTVRAPFDERFAPKDMPIPETFFEKGGPSWLKKARGGRRWKADEKAENTLRRRKALYCGEVKCIDAAVGRILASLRRTGLMEDTIVVYSTDHGDYMGEHGLYGKNNLYETAYRIPLIVRWPRRIRPGTVVDRFFCSVDFMPTILSLMGIATPGREQGRDGAHILTNGKGDWTDEVFIHHSSLERAGIFTPRYELAYVKEGDGILFDRVDDPGQVRNLFDDPARAKAKAELTERIVAHNRAVKAPAAAWLEEIPAGKPHKERSKKA